MATVADQEKRGRATTTLTLQNWSRLAQAVLRTEMGAERQREVEAVVAAVVDSVEEAEGRRVLASAAAAGGGAGSKQEDGGEEKVDRQRWISEVSLFGPWRRRRDTRPYVYLSTSNPPL